MASQSQQIAEAQSKITEANSALGELDEKAAELELRRVETESQLRCGLSKQDLVRTAAATLLNRSVEPPDNPPDAPDSTPFWRSVTKIDINCAIDGVVEQISLTGGDWAEEGRLLISVVDPTQLRFSAMGPQSNLDRLRPGLAGGDHRPIRESPRFKGLDSLHAAIGAQRPPRGTDRGTSRRADSIGGMSLPRCVGVSGDHNRVIGRGRSGHSASRLGEPDRLAGRLFRRIRRII